MPHAPDATGPLFDFRSAAGLPVPVLTTADAEAIAAEHVGLRARAASLGSQQDANFLLTTPDGDAVLGVLKVTNPAFGPLDVAAQTAAAEHLAARDPLLRVATALPGPDGDPQRLVRLPSGERAVVRLLRHLPGGTLSGSGYLSPRVVAALGDVAGRVSVALADFEHPGLRHVLQWDLQHAAQVVEQLAHHVGDPVLRERITDAARSAQAVVERVAADLPRQAVHGDLTDDNVVCTSPGPGGVRLPDGVLDLGDVTASWAVAELAVTLSSLLHHDGSGAPAVLPAVAAFHARRPLAGAEVEALWPLVVLRAAVLVVSSHQQLALDAAEGRGNDYVAANLAHEEAVFEAACALPAAVVTALVRAHLGLPAVSAGPPADATPLAAGADPVVLDLSWAADALDGGAWLEPGTEDALAAHALDAGAALVVTAFGEARLTRTALRSATAPAVVATGVGGVSGTR
ncbi:phosphotransferase [Kineococcus glutinatus]|uniref:Hydroxylysine kinase n=1 Tax=Kineococcus glutinatus TaxID=1070872 RepID=A0ABP9HTK2_9ACTN